MRSKVFKYHGPLFLDEISNDLYIERDRKVRYLQGRWFTLQRTHAFVYIYHMPLGLSNSSIAPLYSTVDGKSIYPRWGLNEKDGFKRRVRYRKTR